MNKAKNTENPADPLDGWSLPAWCYDDAGFYRSECERVFAPDWSHKGHSE